MRVEKPSRTLHFPAMEKQILLKWENENTFQRSIETRSKEKKYNFYDGPPFATGLPHYGHMLAGTIKDAFPRYFTMKGYRVERRFGWDCHGVPVEMLIQKELGLNGRPEIEKYGVAQFNAACRASVLRFSSEWREYIKRFGRWVDMDSEYRTMDRDFMESVWAVIKKLWDKGLIYEGKAVMSYSSALGCTLSNFEASLDYRDVQDPSVTLRAKLLGAHLGKSLLVWTTTPWTLPANVAVAIDAKAKYCEVQDFSNGSSQGETVYLIASRLEYYFPNKETYTVVREFLGSELVGEKYEPFFNQYRVEAGENAFILYAVDYVDPETGTGAVHTAPAFGEDDYCCARQYNLAIIDHLDVSGCYLPQNLADVVGLHFKAGDKLLLSDLKKRGFVFKHETFVHSYPMCYRSGTPLMFRAMPSWFVRVEAFKDQLIAANQEILWVPEHIKNGRFGKWLENARDWNIARARYWGNPIPIWKNDETGEVECLGSVAELEKYSGRKVNDLHMEFIDDIVIKSPTGKGVLKRVPFVLDCWFESGSMPYAQAHFPFENASDFESSFPADFICEGLDQTRGWFYSLNVLSTALFGKPAAKNIVVNGLVLAADGRKMSKSLKNYPDPLEILEELGADSVRLFMLNSPASAGEELRFQVEGVKENTRRILLPLWNAYSFFATYAAIDQFDPDIHCVQSENELDRWILLRANELLKNVDDAMEIYQIAKVCPAIVEFLDDLNNWYIRRNRRRFWESDNSAYSTLFKVLVTVTQILAPFAPFAAEYFYQKLSLSKELQATDSVHLTRMPDFVPLTVEQQMLLDNVKVARRIVELGRNIRTAHKIKNRQPLATLTVGVLSEKVGAQVLKMADVIAEELNVKAVQVTHNPADLARVVVKPNFKVLGKSLGPRIKVLQQLLSELPADSALKALRLETLVVEDFVLTPDMVTVELQGAGSQLVATDCDFVASLDPNITEDLRFEGLARELVSIVQKTRKLAQFEVEDRIELCILASQPFLEAAYKNKAYIEDETLCVLVSELSKEIEFATDVSLEGEPVTLKACRLK